MYIFTGAVLLFSYNLTSNKTPFNFVFFIYIFFWTKKCSTFSKNPFKLSPKSISSTRTKRMPTQLHSIYCVNQTPLCLNVNCQKPHTQSLYTTTQCARSAKFSLNSMYDFFATQQRISSRLNFLVENNIQQALFPLRLRFL